VTLSSRVGRGEIDSLGEEFQVDVRLAGCLDHGCPLPMRRIVRRPQWAGLLHMVQDLVL
jgi:hypothetical protein